VKAPASRTHQRRIAIADDGKWVEGSSFQKDEFLEVEDGVGHVRPDLQFVSRLTELLQIGSQAFDIRFQPSAGNFLLVEAAQPAALFERLQRDGIIIRPVGGYGLKHHVRISVGTAEQNTRLLNTLENLLGTSGAGLLRNQTSSV